MLPARLHLASCHSRRRRREPAGFPRWNLAPRSHDGPVPACNNLPRHWKASEHWVKRLTDDELEQEFGSVRNKLESRGSVFKGTFKRTATCRQFLKQAEIDVVGIRLDGGIHAVFIYRVNRQ